MNEEEINIFLKNLENDEIFGNLDSYRLQTLEEKFSFAMKRFEFIGELPISNQLFDEITKYIYRVGNYQNYLDFQKIPPILFLISMVFFARYSEDETRNFWIPYLKTVWNIDDPNKTLQARCREHFKKCRKRIEESLGLSFSIIDEGDVVRPVYQHAIIPSYLQDHFADWLVKNYESILKYSPEQLFTIFENERALSSIPPRLKAFIQEDDTKETALNLIMQMVSAINLFYETGNSEAVDSIIGSSIKKDLWQAVYRKLMTDPSRYDRIRKIFPKLEWIWNLENQRMSLKLSSVRSKLKEKPDSVVLTNTKKNIDLLREGSNNQKVYPWKDAEEWKMDPVVIEPDNVPLNGCILVLSENFDLSKSRETQNEQIIFEKEVPIFDNTMSFFRVDSRRKIAIHKEQVDSSGEWIIVSDKDFQIFDKTGNQISLTEVDIPFILRKAGFINAKSCMIMSDVFIKTEEHKTAITIKKNSQEFLINPVLEGDKKLNDLSSNVHPIFQSEQIYIKFSIDPENHPLRRTWVFLQYEHETIKSMLLSDLYFHHLLIPERINYYSMDLSSLLTSPGSYNINLYDNFEPLLENPLYFSLLPNHIKIIGPDVGSSFSPQNPPSAQISGISVNQVIPYQEEEIKVTKESEDCIIVEWFGLHFPNCRFDISWENSRFSFCWDIDRISGWIEGGSDKNRVFEGQEKDVSIHVRGRSYETFSWHIQGTNLSREICLDAKGAFSEKLFETVLRDMLKEHRHAMSTVKISMRNQEWKLFEYIKKITVDIISINYINSTLSMNLKYSERIYGPYHIQISEMDSLSLPIQLAVHEYLEDHHSFPVKLQSGKYQVDIILNDEILQSSQGFQVNDLETANVQIPKLDISSIDPLFTLLTSNEPMANVPKEREKTIRPILDQLKFVHTRENWITNSLRDDGLKQLLPSWAVLMYPLRFETKDHQKILHVYPEQAAYGGKAGKGYIALKIEGEKTRVCASWKPSVESGYSDLWIGIPQEMKSNRYCECDEDDLWPAYQCISCGTILATRDGTYLKFPRSVLQYHCHGQNKTPRDCFIEIKNDDHIKVEITQFSDTLLVHSYHITDIFIKDYLQKLRQRMMYPIRGDLKKPFDFFTNIAYCCAVSELNDHLDNETMSPYFNQIREKETFFQAFTSYIVCKRTIIPAFGAMCRLLKEMSERDFPTNIPRFVLVLSMVSRLKANNPQTYRTLLSETGANEDEIIPMINSVLMVCPKLFEWSMTWSEIFYIHAVS